MPLPFCGSQQPGYDDENRQTQKIKDYAPGLVKPAVQEATIQINGKQRNRHDAQAVFENDDGEDGHN
jgi:hypothetical protein